MLPAGLQMAEAALLFSRSVQLEPDLGRDIPLRMGYTSVERHLNLSMANSQILSSKDWLTRGMNSPYAFDTGSLWTRGR